MAQGGHGAVPGEMKTLFCKSRAGAKRMRFAPALDLQNKESYLMLSEPSTLTYNEDDPCQNKLLHSGGLKIIWTFPNLRLHSKL
jgi:hypothetical protein